MQCWQLTDLGGRLCRAAADEVPVPWEWKPYWADRKDPVPATLVEVARIQRPKQLRLSADVLSSVEFSQDGMLLATAGRAKQVATLSSSCLVVLLLGMLSLENLAVGQGVVSVSLAEPPLTPHTI